MMEMEGGGVFCKGCRVCVCLRQAQTGAYDLIGCCTDATASSAFISEAAKRAAETASASTAQLMQLKLEWLLE
jgi:hypothetical protein